MKLKIFNGNQEEIKENNIFIGISIGIKPLTKELAKEYIEWALKNTKDKVAILIADEISKINYQVFSSYNENKSMNRALREGDKYVSLFEEIIAELPTKDQEKVQILRWKAIVNPEYLEQLSTLQQEFKNNSEFKEKILYFIDKYTERREKNITSEQKEFLADYILHELPTLFDGIEHNGLQYKVLLYPTFVHSGMSEFVTLISAEFKDKLSLKGKTILVEAYIKI